MVTRIQSYHGKTNILKCRPKTEYFDKKCRSMSSEMLSQHVQQMAHMKKKTKDDLDPLYDVKKKEQVSFGSIVNYSL